MKCKFGPADGKDMEVPGITLLFPLMRPPTPVEAANGMMMHVGKAVYRRYTSSTGEKLWLFDKEASSV